MTNCGTKKADMRASLSEQDMARVENWVSINERLGGQGWWHMMEAVSDPISGTCEALDIFIIDQIGSFGQSADSFIDILVKIKTPLIRVRLNTTGGSYTETIRVFDALTAHPAKVEGYVSGLACSSGSLLVMACDVVYMAEDAFFLIHHAYTEKDAMLKSIVMLSPDNCNRKMVDLFSRKTGIPKELIKEWMDGETLFNSSEALELGFVDKIIPAEEWCSEHNVDAIKENSACLRILHMEIDRMLDLANGKPLQAGNGLGVIDGLRKITHESLSGHSSRLF